MSDTQQKTQPDAPSTAASKTEHILDILHGGAPERTRTSDPLLRRQLLYPLSYGRAEISFYLFHNCTVSNPSPVFLLRGSKKREVKKQVTKTIHR